MAAEGNNNNFMRYVYRGEDGEHIPNEATHITVGDGVTFVRAEAFARHRNVIEVICHKRVKKIEEGAFANCPSLRRVIMPGVLVVEEGAFYNCIALEDAECGKLEIIGKDAFCCCWSLRSINLPSIRIIEKDAFCLCRVLVDAKIGNKLERFDSGAFDNCPSLARLIIPLKDGLITRDDIFQGCKQLEHVDLVEEELLKETVAALSLVEWRNDMNEEIDSINQILSDTCAGVSGNYNPGEEGGKARAIRRWVRSILFKIDYYKAEHQKVLDEAATALRLALPHDHDTMMNSVLPFLELPPHTFG